MSPRIALISEHASPLGSLGGVDGGGQNVYVNHIARELAGRGWEVDVFTRRDHELLTPVADWVDGVQIIHVSAGPARHVPKEQLLPLMPAFTRATLRHCQSRQYDLVHANFWMSGLVACEVKRELGIPFVITFHALGRVRRQFQPETDNFPLVRLEIEERLVREADRIIAECPQDVDDLVSLYGADREHIATVPCGFDPAEFWPLDKPFARAALSLPQDERYVLQLGRLVPRKGVDTAICAIAELERRHDLRATLLVVGGESDEPDPAITPEIGRLQAVAEAEGVADRVQFVGRRDRAVLKYFYGAADAFVTTPWYEPFGITPLESMACGTPVVGSNVGGIKHSVRDGETGYLVPARDPVSLADRLADLFECPDRRRQMGRAAIRRVNDHFTWRLVVDELTNIYREVISESASGRHADLVPELEVLRAFDGAIRTLRDSKQCLSRSLVTAADLVSDCFSDGGKVLVCGNGGSAADALHFAAELVGRFKQRNRPGLPVLPLTADIATLTAWSNDVGYDDVFARQLEAFGRRGDVLLGLSTSGRSANVVKAFQVAQTLGIRTVALLGGTGGDVGTLADVTLTVPTTDTQHIQETHLVLLHALCELVERHVAAGVDTPDRDEVKELPRPVERRGNRCTPARAIARVGRTQ